MFVLRLWFYGWFHYYLELHPNSMVCQNISRRSCPVVCVFPCPVREHQAPERREAAASVPVGGGCEAKRAVAPRRARQSVTKAGLRHKRTTDTRTYIHMQTCMRARARRACLRQLALAPDARWLARCRRLRARRGPGPACHRPDPRGRATRPWSSTWWPQAAPSTARLAARGFRIGFIAIVSPSGPALRCVGLVGIPSSHQTLGIAFQIFVWNLVVCNYPVFP